MIRPDLLQAVQKTLGEHAFLSLEDFDVSEYTNKESQPCV